MKVRDVMISPVITITPDTTYEEAARLLHANRISGVPVVDAAGKLAGIVSEKDLFRAMYPLYEEYILEPHAYYNQERQEEEIEAIRKQPVEKFMSKGVVVISPHESILHAGGLMLARGLHRLPVVDGGRLIGIVTREDIYGTILKKHFE
ncbi:MAG: CBS domain-containing protein [Patescibacteria group bacterium]|nr:CBS domain-containing protein [Patescibacteria group bacterium]